MPRIAYVNGRYVAHADASVHIEDRGYQFADGVYEVCEVARGYIVDMKRHLDRLGRSLNELGIAWPMTRKSARNRLARGGRPKPRRQRTGLSPGDARGRRPRLCVPGQDIRPALVVTARKVDPAIGAKRAENGIKVITVPENRWDRVDIKSVGLLPNVLAQTAGQGGRRSGGVVRRCRRQRQGRRVIERLDRHQGRFPGHAACRARHPARHHPDDAVRGCGQSSA